MRIISYNILDGGEGRADPLAEVIEAQRPDLVALQESALPEVVERIANRLAMDWVIAEGGSQAVALLSRWPIAETINHALLRPAPCCCLEARVPTPAGQALTLGIVHFSPRSFDADEQIREREVADLLDIFAPHRAEARPHILLGDFNSNSPLQEIEPEKLNPVSTRAWRENGNQIPRRVIQRLLDAGYTDTLHAVHGPAASRMTSFTTLYLSQRLDYIFTHSLPPGAIRDAWIELDRLAQFASDHYPVGADISA